MQESKEAESVSARDFVERELRANADISYAEIQARASRVGLNVPRFLYGSMRRALGLPPRPEGLAKEAAAGAEAAAAEGEQSAPSRAAAEPAADDPCETTGPDEAAALAAVASTSGAAAAADATAADATAAGTGPRTGKKSAFDFAVEVLRMS